MIYASQVIGKTTLVHFLQQMSVEILNEGLKNHWNSVGCL